MTTPTALAAPAKWLASQQDAPGPRGALVRALTSAGALPRSPGGFTAAARRHSLPLELHAEAATAAAEYVALRTAAEKAEKERRLHAEAVAVVYRVVPSWDRTTHLVMARCERDGRDVMHGGGPTSGPVYLGHRVAHCGGCSSYELADPEGMADAVALEAPHLTAVAA